MTDQLPPHSFEDERGVLSCCLQNAEDCLPECSKVNDDSFYDERNKTLWRAIQTLASANQGINQATVYRQLKQMDSEELGRTYLPELLNDDNLPASSLSNYLPSLHDYAIKRRVIRGCVRLSAIAMNGHTGLQVMANAERLLAIENPNQSEVLNGKQAGDILIDDLQRRFDLQGNHSGLPTGFYALDQKLDGLQFGEQTLIAARPSKGKTALGLGIFHKLCFKDKVPSLFVSLEMSTGALMRRMMSSHANLEMNEIRRGTYNDGDFKKMTAFRVEASKVPMHILDGVAGLTCYEICCQVKRMVRKHGIKLVVVDYMQKVKPDIKHEKRTYEVADVSGKLRALAVETKAAFLTLAQLNREGEKDKGRPPRLSDLGDSGQIERDADTVIMIHHSENDGVRLIVGKQRDGEIGVVPVTFNGPYCRFENKQNDTPTQPHND